MTDPMTERTVKRTRGRPRQFDEEEAVALAGNVFWINGFSATSLDDLSAAMNMNRPSIYRAFGDKKALYRRALAQFAAQMESAMKMTLFAEADVHKALTGFYREALAVYVSGDKPKGCLVMSTAVSAAVSHPEVQEDLLAVIQKIDRGIETRLKEAIQAEQLSAEFDPGERANLAQSILHSLSLRARAGESKARLNRMLVSGVGMILGS